MLKGTFTVSTPNDSEAKPRVSCDFFPAHQPGTAENLQGAVGIAPVLEMNVEDVEISPAKTRCVHQEIK